ncbi:MAG: hypothetical protein MJE77_14390 [Proteobacteria bacterium]|nr:hypothetical protein [Pseudomonadota bacterium]
MRQRTAVFSTVLGWLNIALTVAALLIATTANATADTISQVRHVPPAEAPPHAPLALVATVASAWEGNLEVRFRPLGTTSWQGAVFARQDADQYAVTIPAVSIQPPGIEYFIISTGQATVAHFGSAGDPHSVAVFRPPVAVRRDKHLARHGHRRAQIRVAGQYVDYGSRTIGDRSIPDRYYRVDADVGYRLLRFPLKTLRFGYTHLIGETPKTARNNDGTCQPNDDPADRCTLEAGLKGGGWFELRFILRDGVEFDARGMVMATQQGFNVGGRSELRLGDSQGTHVGLGAEIIADVGTAGFFRLGWGTVPGFLMSATVEVTDFPAPHRDLAVRLIYDVARLLPGGVRIGARLGYQARDQLIGGITAGLSTALDF